ncbi:MAG: tRNA (N6-isopentenyl adenosine(37)-C2)-methylthiotransferase MiaB [Mollicutes bacterium]|nr:tRNA (N6-isopentenyl adenosine(37)-C2)-methylthiotransferase MiaB [Mollicutes bacterium]
MKLPNYEEAKSRTKVDIVYKDVNIKYEEVFKNKKYFLRTYGCQMNVHDSEEISNYLIMLGMSKTEVLKDADVILLNTCAIRENAHDKVIGFLGRCKHVKKLNKDLIIIIMGCMAAQEDVVKEFQDKHKYIDIIIGPNNIYDLPKLLLERQKGQNIEVHSNSDIVPENVKYHRDSKISAWVNVMYGCDKFCTYCIVPYTRGRERSRKKEAILKECKCLIENGYQEITLLGQNVNAYGNDLYSDYNFASLLEDIAKLGIPRLRFVTSHPWNFTDKMIDVIAKYDNIMPYIHLPIQSGSNNILRKMNRRYTKEEYLNLVDKIRKKIPKAAITTDIIVGFPGETKEDFKETIDVVNCCKFDGAYTFIFSKRKGTPAALLKDDTPLEEKEKRLATLNELVNRYSKENNKRLLGKMVPVLIMGVSEKDNTKMYGYTDTFKLVNVAFDKAFIGKIIAVKIIDAKSFSLDGKLT